MWHNHQKNIIPFGTSIFTPVSTVSQSDDLKDTSLGEKILISNSYVSSSSSGFFTSSLLTPYPFLIAGKKLKDAFYAI